MECNKEEAVRAKVLAEKKMDSKDFVGARKIAIKAQRLYPELENINQIICVCDVHCSAETKNLGNEKDWYGILQVEQSADDVIIKKQYRKFALLLHPDKNKFPGAEAAFKFIGEAQRVLLDREKRSFYDSRYRRFGQSMAPNKPPQANRNANTMRQCWGQSNMNNNASPHVNWSPNQEAYSKASNGWETSLAACPSCRFQFSYYKDGNKLLQCQRCMKPFFAGDTNAQWIPPGSNPRQTATYTRVDISNQGVKISASNVRYQGNSGPQMPGGDSFTFPKSGLGKEVGGSKTTNEFNMNANKMNRGSSAASIPGRKDIGKRGKKRVVEESSDSFQSESSTDCEDAESEKKHYAAEDDSNRRRSSRAKRHVSYNENGNDDDEIFNSGLKNESMDTTRSTGSAEINKANGNDPVVEENVQEGGKVDNGYESDFLSEDSPKTLDVPDPDFNDFDKLRKKECFKTGQIWAIYDSQEAMPRFYAQIKRVFTSGFKVRINWLEADPEEEDELLWVKKNFPYPCGKFSYGHAETTEDLPMFSHLMLEKVRGRDRIYIYPKKHETWALFENWNGDWISNPEYQMKYDYQFVEVLSDYDKIVGIRVAILTKLKGFVCVFCRRGGDEIQLQPSDLLRFSHRVPSFRVTGEERKGVPTGSFELDPASVPLHLLQK